MRLEAPNLDDRTWQDLMDDAVARIRATTPDWTDLGPSDPGIVLLDAFAYLTECLIYRLNKVPPKLYVEFLRLIGVTLHPPTAAATDLVFRRTGDVAGPIRIPAGTRVTTAGGADGPVFATVADATLEAGRDEVSVRALDAELIEAEPATVEPGPGGARIAVRRPPIVAATRTPDELIVAVEATADDLREGAAGLEYAGKSYRIWREVDTFADAATDARVYVADRLDGTIMFSPAALWTEEGGPGEAAGGGARGLSETVATRGATPAPNREVRTWYRRGGGPGGNVASGSLTTMVDGIAGLEVQNPERATGGRAAETIENALIRGPQEFHSLRRAVTARDFELLATRAMGDVARARAHEVGALALRPSRDDRCRPGAGRARLDGADDHERWPARAAA
jgi:hypothetical protein